MDTQSFVVRYSGFVDEITTDCLVIKAFPTRPLQY